VRTSVGVHVARVRGVVSHRERQRMFVAVGGRLHDRRSVRRLVPTLRQPHRWLRSQIPQPVRVAGAPSGRDEEQTFLVPVNNTTGVVRSRRPTPPAPITATVVPGSTPAVLIAAPTPVITEQPTSAAMSIPMSSGILTNPEAGVSEYSAKPLTLASRVRRAEILRDPKFVLDHIHGDDLPRAGQPCPLDDVAAAPTRRRQEPAGEHARLHRKPAAARRVSVRSIVRRIGAERTCSARMGGNPSSRKLMR